MAGLPCVMYDIPYLSLVEGYRGIEAVEPLDVAGAANAVIELLSNSQKRYQLSADARVHAEEIISYDYSGKWDEIFSSLGLEHETSVLSESKWMIENLVEYHDNSLKTLKKENAEYSRQSSALEEQNKALEKQSNISQLPFLLRYVSKGYLCIKDHGFIYSVKLFFKKCRE